MAGAALDRGLLPLLIRREWRHHPWRHGVALLAVALGVALAWSVYLINASALAEFASAARSVGGTPDLVLRGAQGLIDDALYERVAADPVVAAASPVLEIDTYARGAGQADGAGGTGGAAPNDRTDGGRAPLHLLGIDALQVATLAPALLPQPAPGAMRLAFLDPDVIFVNAAARRRYALADGASLQLQVGAAYQTLRVAGSVAAGGAPLAVMDIAAAQQRYGAVGRISRIDLRLTPGSDRAALLARLALPAGVIAADPGSGERELDAISRAYRVNLTVLALVALFVGAFLVYSVVSLSVAQRTPTFALLGVLGLTSRERRSWVLAECGLIGAAGSAVGIALGAGLAALALRLLAGDLGSGVFAAAADGGAVPPLRIDAAGAFGFALLGTASALVGGWWPALQAQRIAPALALKGLGQPERGAPPAWPGLALLAIGAMAAFAPPIGGLPLAAYAAVAALLFGGVALVPAAVHGLLAAAPEPPPTPRGALALLALRRAGFQRRTATAAVAGVVASLALSVALTVMVASFRGGVGVWLDRVLPADLYARSAGSSSGAERVWLPRDFVARAQVLPGVQRLQASRTRALRLAPGQPAVALLARPDVSESLPLLAPALPRSLLRPGEIAAYASEAAADLYGAAPGAAIELPLDGRTLHARVLGVWRDYARQFGSIAVDLADYRRGSGDERVNDIAVWLRPGADADAVRRSLLALLPDASMLDFADSAELRRITMRIFDRSFAVTYYLQAVAIAIGLVGIAASLSAQVLARRKEFGLLGHLGLTRGQIVGVVAGEGLAWVAAGTLVGIALGIAISLVLVYVVNPQSFHWSMDLVLPWGRIAALAAAVLAAGTATAAFSARSAATRQAVLSVKEDW
ncbi:MAG: ABC transporter permease [Burkholderiales bacterium]|nr:ABC transporter permease [Burkholderiales bacterium]